MKNISQMVTCKIWSDFLYRLLNLVLTSKERLWKQICFLSSLQRIVVQHIRWQNEAKFDVDMFNCMWAVAPETTNPSRRYKYMYLLGWRTYSSVRLVYTITGNPIVLRIAKTHHALISSFQVVMYVLKLYSFLFWKSINFTWLKCSDTYFHFLSSQLPVVTGPGILPHYQLGDLGLIPRPKQTIPTSLDKMRVLSATTRLGGLRKVLCRSVGVQTVSAPKVRFGLLWTHVMLNLETCLNRVHSVYQ